MLSLQQAYEVKASIIEYLKATFTFKERKVQKAFNDFMLNEQEGLFKGPYVSLKLPFVKATPEESKNIPLEIQPPFDPFAHQLLAFERLSTRKSEAQPTILTTGTGSGKTESFLYPILDYCYQNQQPGIKAIILYPMNALATDQAQRIAESIWEDERLKGKITAGLFIGVGAEGGEFKRTMGPDHIIEDRKSILDSPPDIILTNFKMLDYALMRSDFSNLWQLNQIEPNPLKFLVLDELHTYDGAQGTDVANLIRRMKLKLNLPEGHLCPVGTSATIGSGEDSKLLLAEYASTIFGESFEEEALIEEHRVTAEQFFGTEELNPSLPSNYQLGKGTLGSEDDFDSYIKKQLDIWGLNPDSNTKEIGAHLKTLQIVKDIVALCEGQIKTVAEIVRELQLKNTGFRYLSDDKKGKDFSEQEGLVLSLLSLISTAKQESGGKLFPFLYLQVQIWIREMSGVVRKLQEECAFTWRESREEGETVKSLPAYFCRECGSSGWLVEKKEGKDNLESDILSVYSKFFSNDKNIYFMNKATPVNERLEEYEVSDEFEEQWLDESLYLNEEKAEDGNSFKVVGYRKLIGPRNDHVCPQCNTKNTLSIIGTRTTTLASITNSQVLSTNLDQSAEKERKVLAFTNSVQDAAHQAGFVQARNYTFTFRSALQKVINLQGSPLTLSELQKAFVEYWEAASDESGEDHQKAYYYKFFPSDRDGEVIIESFMKTEKERKRFREEFNRRIYWQIAAEFGYNAVIGRTLEKTGSSSTYFDLSLLEKVYEKMRLWFQANIEEEDVPDQKTFLAFLSVFLHRTRTRGAIDHPYFNVYRTDKSAYYSLTVYRNKPFFLMKNFGKKTRLPRLLTDEPYRKSGTSTALDVVVIDSAPNWFSVYFKKCFPKITKGSLFDAELFSINGKRLINDFYKELLTVLSSKEVSMLDEKESTGLRNHCLFPAAIKVGKGAVHLSCDVCDHQLNIHPESIEEVKGGACMRYRCTGRYAAENKTEYSYYEQVYNRKRIPRIYAHEHTGLLPRMVREEVEDSFKKSSAFDAYNVLVATSTLEMGINVGDLNTTMNTSVPPLPSNFLQRIGRAGRKSGSALVVNFVNNKPHDIYFFSDPMEMMQGAVNTPGCYLSAKDILARHFIAFCIDSWTSDDPAKNNIPRSIKDIDLEKFKLDKPDFFINKIIWFIQQQEQKLLERFKGQYVGAVDDAVFNEIAIAIRSGDFYAKLQKVFSDLKKEFDLLIGKQKQINAEIKERGLGKEDPARVDLNKEWNNIRGTIKVLKSRSILEYLTNVGILPNYAFPETGVQLYAQVRRNTGNEEQGNYEPKVIDIVRPAESAISELIPDNYFYAQGFKLKISGVRVLSEKEEMETYRFCSRCDHLELDLSASKGNCPKCHDPSWQSAGNIHKFVHFKGALSFNDERSAVLDDDTDDRKSVFSKKSTHFTFEPESAKGAYAMVEIPFGIEYVKQVKMLVANTGVVTERASKGQNIKMNGQEVSRAGYILCRHCGKTSSSIYDEKFKEKEARDYHFGFCKSREEKYQGQEDDHFNELFLYRQLQTEAIKVLLPVRELESEAEISMFKAGILLGLKSYYRGNPQHIRIEDYLEINEQTGQRDRYLVLLDVIPGGTGYLEKLFNPDEFNKILKFAYEKIQICSCQSTGKDGCYHCIFTYLNQFNQNELSRNKAEQLFKRLIDAADHWEILEQGLGKVSLDVRLEESRLEDRFVFLIKKMCEDDDYKQKKNCEFEIRKDENGKNYYSLKIKHNKTKIQYYIKPQISLDKRQGVPYATVPDFLIECVDYQEDGEAKVEYIDAIRPIAVYLDGYEFHASEKHPNLTNDLKRRNGVKSSGRFWTWTLTWADLQLFEKRARDEYSIIGKEPWRKKAASKKHPALDSYQRSIEATENNMDRLLWVLENPLQLLATNFHMFIFNYQEVLLKHSIQKNDFIDFSNNLNTEIADYQRYVKADSLIWLNRLPKTEFFIPRIGSDLNNFSIWGRMVIRMKNNGFEKTGWQYFWSLYNMIQFEDNIEFLIDEEGIEGSSAEETDKALAGPVSIKNMLDNFDEELHKLVKQLHKKGIAFNQDTEFSIEEGTRTLATAALGIESMKIVVDVFEEDYEKVFLKAGYQIFQLEEIAKVIALIK